MFRRSNNIFRRGKTLLNTRQTYKYKYKYGHGYSTSSNPVRLDNYHTHQLVKHMETHNRGILKTLISNDGTLIRYVSIQTEELVFESVRQRGLNLFYVGLPFRTVNLCEYAVYEDPWALEHVDEIFQTVPMCMYAVNRDWRTIMFVKNQTLEICECAVRGNWYALGHVKNKTDRLCILALGQDLKAMRFIDGGIIRKMRLYLLSKMC